MWWNKWDLFEGGLVFEYIHWHRLNSECHCFYVNAFIAKKNSSSWYESHLEKLVFLKVVEWMNACMKLTWHLHHSFHNYCLTIKWISINLNASFNSNIFFVAFDEDMKLLLFILIILLEFYAGRLRFD